MLCDSERKMMTPLKGNYIGGAWQEAHGAPLTCVDPTTGDISRQGVAASSQDVMNAVHTAKTAFPSWMTTPLSRRKEILLAFAKTVTTHRDTFAKTISQETGKPLWEAHTEVDSVIGKVAISLEAYEKRCGEVLNDKSGVLQATRAKPHGVVAVLGPFNLPGHLPNGHIVPALLAGNTVIFKPSEFTPVTAELLATYWQEAQLPPGVFNVVQGDGEVGKTLAHHDVDGLFFTGSFAVGLELSSYFGQHPEKILALEMGGNNPILVGDVDDVSSAAYLVAVSAFITAGQRCSCARRLIIQDGAYGERVVRSLCEVVSHLRVGAYTATPEPFLGPVIGRGALERLFRTWGELLRCGGKELMPLRHLEGPGFFVTPGVCDVTEVTRTDDEVFGPLLQVIRVRDFEEGVKVANETRYGLAAGLISSSKKEYDIFYRDIRAGVVNWNMPLTGASSAAPFGGVGRSGNHRPSAYYAADFCSYPVASMEREKPVMPEKVLPGVKV